MVALLGENTLLLMRPADRGQLVPQLLENVKDMPREVKPGLIKVKVSGAPDRNGQVRFTLPSGQSFQATPTQPLPQGSTALVQIRPDGNPPQVLRVILPAQNGQQSALQQSTSPSVLMSVAKQSTPQIGEALQVQPQTGQTGNNLRGNSQSSSQAASQTTTARLPVPGAQVVGQVQTPPSGGFQTIQLANQTPLLVANPPVFDVGSNLTLRITGLDSAVLEKITQPRPQGQSQIQPQGPSQLQGQLQGRSQNQGSQQNPQADQRPQISYPTTQRAAPPQAKTDPPQRTQVQNLPSGQNQPSTANQSPTAGAGTRQQLPLFQLRALTPVPTQLQQNTQTITLTRIEQNTYTLQTENGLELKVRPVNRETAAPTGQNNRSDTSLQGSQRAGNQTAQQPTLNTLTTGSNMSVRFTESGLIDVMQVAQPRNHLGPNHNQRQGGQSGNQGQMGGDTGRQNTPQNPALASGHIATGTVTQQKSDGRLFLQFDKGVTVEVQAQRLLPVGSKLSIQIMPDGHAEIIDMSLPRGTERSNSLMRLAVAWEGLNTATETLARSNPDIHQKMINALPRANENLLPQLIQFSNAVAQQNLQAMLGDEIVNVLRALGLDGMLQADLGQMNALQQPRPDSPDSWRALLFPYWDEQEEQARQGGFFWRRQHKDDAENAAPDEGTLRFVVNVDMSEIGHTQLDGLMQEHESLYLKLRTQNPLSEDEKSGLRELVSKSLDALGLEGQVLLETANFFEVDPLHDILRAEGGDQSGENANQINVEA